MDQIGGVATALYDQPHLQLGHRIGRRGRDHTERWKLHRYPVHIASLRGVRLSKVISYGNALDVNQNELFEYFTDDPKTKVILSYVEGLKGDTRQFLNIVRKAAAKKPVVICKGGRTSAGARMAVTRSSSLAGSGAIWEVAMRQAGAVPARHLDEMINLAVAFSMLTPIRGKRVAVVGAGGGEASSPPMPGQRMDLKSALCR